MQHLQPNTTLQGGKYRIEKVLGQGGFGITYLAEQVSLNRQVAIKELFIGGIGQAINDRRGKEVIVTNSVNQTSFDQQREKFKKEAKRLANLNHPNLVKVHELFEENGTAYYVMEYINGKSLRTKLIQEGNLPEKLVLNYLQQLLPALNAAHQQNIWHLDIKPENIMVDKDGHVYLIDFGASKHIVQNQELTTTLALAYTPGYCPPELSDLLYGHGSLVETLKDIGPWTDIYALGATMYNLLTGNIPPSPNRLYKDGSNAFMFSSYVSSSTQDLIFWMMKPNKEDRPQSIIEIKCQSGNAQSIYNESTIINSLAPICSNTDIIYILKSIARNLKNYDDYPYSFYDGYAVVRKYGRHGFINKNGYEVIPCIYDDAGDFHEGLAYVNKNGKWGYIDKNNKTVVPLIYESASSFSQGLALVKKNNRYGYIDHAGREVIQCTYESADSFSEGLARVVTKGKTGYIDISGNLIIPQLYAGGWSFHNGIAIVCKIRKLFVERQGGIDKHGSEIVPFVYSGISTFGTDGFAVVSKNNKSGLIDVSGNQIVPCIYEEARAHDKLVPVAHNSKWGFINTIGNIVIPFKFFEAYGFQDEMCIVRDFNYFYGYVNKNGDEIVPCKYQHAHNFNNGFADVQFHDKWGVINKQGKLVVPCIYDSIGKVVDGLAFVRKNGVLGCVDVEGRSSFDYN